MRPISSSDCILVQDIKAVTHENPHVHESVSTQTPTEGNYKIVIILLTQILQFFFPRSINI